MVKITGALQWPNDRCYLFEDDHYYRLDNTTGLVDMQATQIAQEWRGLWPSGKIVPVWWGYGKAFFFRGSEYVRYDISDKVDDGYDPPIPIADRWPGLWSSDIDAAFNYGNGKLYFFKADEYLRYDISEDKVDDNYPKKIADGWIGIWDRDIDAVLYQGGEKVLFFKGSDFRVFDLAQDAVVEDTHPVSQLRGEALPSGTNTPARDLSANQANGLLGYLVKRSLITLRATQTPYTEDAQGNIATPKPGQNIALQPAAIAGVTLINKQNPTANVTDNIDQRLLVALYRLTQWLNASAETIQSLTHLGIGHGKGASTDCHNQGRALDLSAIGFELDGTTQTVDVKTDWGGRPCPDPTMYRLTRIDGPAYSLFLRAYTFGTYECECTKPGQNRWPPTTIGEAGYVICPDYNAADAQLRSDHNNHIHMQIGVTK